MPLPTGPSRRSKPGSRARCREDGLDPEAELAEFLGEGQDASAFWQQVKTNLQAGRVRLIFIADEIPPELRRVVEFLNSQMDPAEVLAIEVKQFVGENLKTLVPRVLGQTETARQKKSADRGEARQWDEPSFFDGPAPDDGASKRWRSHGNSAGMGEGTRASDLVGRGQEGRIVLPDVRQQVRQELPLLGLDLRDRGASVPAHEAAAVLRGEKRKELAAPLSRDPGVSIPERPSTRDRRSSSGC